MIQIYKNYEGKKELEELDHIELESWVMVTDPTMEELTSISVDYKIDMDDLKAALDTEERSRLENEDDYTMILVNIPVVEEENGKKWYETIPLGIFITRKKIRRILQAVRDDFCILQENHGIKKKKQKSYISY